MQTNYNNINKLLFIINDYTASYNFIINDYTAREDIHYTASGFSL